LTPRRGEAGRGPGASRDQAPAPSGAILAALLFSALLLRLVIAYVLFPNSGFRTDIGTFQAWAITLANLGPGGFYQQGGLADYAPGYMYVLWLVGVLSQTLSRLSHIDQYVFTAALVKVPAIVFDLALGYLIYRTLRAWNGERVALAGAALYLFNPVTWYVSALWGQVDSVGTFVLVVCVLLLVGGWSEAAAGTAVLATLIKPQYGIVLFVVGFVLLGRHLLRPGSGPRPRPRHPLAVRLNEALGGWFTAEQGPWRLVSSGAVGLLVLFVLITPFDLAELAAKHAPNLPIGGDLGGLVVVFGQAAGQYHFLTINAYNPWALVGAQSLASTWLWNAQSDLTPAFGNVPWFAIGAFLMALAVALLGYRFMTRSDRSSIIVTATVLAVAFFILPTRVHERYIFPAFALGALLAGASLAWRRWYIVLALANVVNIHAVLTYPLYGTPNVLTLPFGELSRSEEVVTLIAVTMAALFAWAIWQLRPAARDVFEPTPVRDRGRRAPDAPMVWRTPWTPLPDLAALQAPESTAVPSPSAPPPSLLPATTERSELEETVAMEDTLAAPGVPWEDLRLEPPRWLATLRRRIRLPALRPDRSRQLHAEGPGRIDRLDLLALVLILVLGLALRTFRADQPFQMVTLDEIYHARTATEFLQDWRYGMPDAIYEYTHPHLAKYLMAAGIVTLGDDRVVATSDLGTPVQSVALERRYPSPERPGQRAGDRLFVATGDAIRVIDLRSGADEATLPVRADAVTVDQGAHRVYGAGAGGVIWSLETSALDRWREVGGDIQEIQPVEVARVDGPIDALWALAPDRVVARVGERIIALDPDTGTVLSTRSLPELNAAVTLGSVATVVAHPESIVSLPDTARTVADLLGLDPQQVETALSTTSADPDVGVRVVSYVTAEQRTAVQEAIDNDQLTGIEVDDRIVFAATSGSGIVVIDGTSLETIAQVPLDAAAEGLDVVGEGTERRLYVAMADQAVQTVRLPDNAAPVRKDRLPMPGLVRDVRWNPATNLIHVLGATPTGQPTVYLIESHGDAVFGDAALPFSPAAWAMDVQPDTPASDREHALLFAADGRAATVDIGQNAFAWRFPGIFLGVLMAAALYLLARFLFRRRAVALLAAAALLTDGMLFAHSRDAMNDSYVGFFIVAAFAVLAWLWMPGAGRRSTIALALGLPLVGVLLGLGLASKWAAAFAIGATVLLILLRSALGRLVALAGMVVLAGLLGNLSLATGNAFFAVLMLAMTFLMAGALAWRPMAFSNEELRFAAVAPVVLGIILVAGTAAGLHIGPTIGIAGQQLRFLLVSGALFIVTGALAAIAFPVAQRLGWITLSRGPADAGPESSGPSRDPDLADLAHLAPSPPPTGWLRPGAGLGIPSTYALLCVAVLPFLVYVLSYVPWARPWDPACPLPANDCPQIIPATVAPDGTTLSEGWPAGHRGQTLYDLTIGMYNYHNDLRATHPASSPWWAWPFDLKPVWLFQDSHGAGTSAVIFDAGNLVTFWLSVPAFGFAFWQAWRRRSLALAFVGIAFLAQWLAWARIDRVTFQYHYYTALPFAFLLLGYFLAELWHGPSARTWVLARVAAAVAILAPGLLWLAKDPLCTLAGVQSVAPSSYLCTNVSGSLVIPTALVATLLVLLAGLALLARELIRLGGRTVASGSGAVAAMPLAALGRVAVIAVAAGLAATVAPRLAGDGSFTFTGSIGQAWLVGLAYLVGAAAFAWLALGARDPRRYVAITLVAAVGWLISFYPYISDLPLPAGAPYIYQRILPTFDYSFQFASNREPSPHVGLFDPQGFVLVASIGIAVLVGTLLVRQWRADRLAMGEPSLNEGEPASP
jgi:Gpi18-like mannosyltransferase